MTNLPSIRSISALSTADEPAYRDFLTHVEPTDLARRVMGGMAEVPDDVIAALLDPAGKFGAGYAARTHDSDELVGVVRLAPTAIRTELEVAILVRSNCKRSGIGRALMDHAIAVARAGDCAALTAITEVDNQAFIGLATQLGFSAHWDAIERVTMLRLELRDAHPGPSRG